MYSFLITVELELLFQKNVQPHSGLEMLNQIDRKFIDYRKKEKTNTGNRKYRKFNSNSPFVNMLYPQKNV